MSTMWTPEQEDAIFLDCNSILVSAAAGSGKTSVLTARIMRKLLQEQNPISLQNILVVTFSKASAADLKRKIRTELQKIIAQNPQKTYLSKQLFELPSAQISTIHSFCFSLIREHFQSLGLSAKLRIADTAEMELLYDMVMNETINDYYNGVYNDIADFSAFADSFVNDRDDILAKKWIEWHKTFSTYANGIELLLQYADKMEKAAHEGFFTSAWGLQILDSFMLELSYYQSVYTDALRYLTSGEQYPNKLVLVFEKEKEMIEKTIFLLKNKDMQGALNTISDYLELNLNLQGVSLGSRKTNEINFYYSTRAEFKRWMQKAAQELALASDEVAPKLLLATADYCKNLYTVLSHYQSKLTAQKKERSILDFHDLEHYSFELLYDEHGNPSQIAKELSQQYQEIFIDEYQDVNELQDKIFRAIGQNTASFMVGDIKQSIYRFQGADPFFFAHYRDAYHLYNKEEGLTAPENTIFLSKNFRCQMPIVKTANAIFSALFTHNSQRVKYYPQDDLVFGVKPIEQPQQVTVAVFDSKEAGKNDDSFANGNEIEIHYVAQEILKLMQNGVFPGDIAILMNSMKEEKSDPVRIIFNEYGIPLQGEKAASLLDYAEIKLILSLLQILDNPASDIDLTAVLLSPIYAFSLQEIADIRASAPKEKSLFSALTNYVNTNPLFKKGVRFLDAWQQYRLIAQRDPTDKILLHLYHQTDIFHLIGRNATKQDAENAKERLLTLYSYAKRFESTSFCGLYRFLQYLKDVIEKNQEIETDRSASQTNAVQLMTIHKSKGLEFKVCFVIGCADNLYVRDTSKSTLFCPNLGIGVTIRDKNGIATYDTPLRCAISHRMLEDKIDEYIRLLYVALTRAKEKLYIVGSPSDSQMFFDMCKEQSKFLSFPCFLHNPSFLAWICMAIGNSKDENAPFSVIFPPIPKKRSAFLEEKETDNTSESVDKTAFEKDLQLFQNRLNYQYPNTILTKTPAKFSVSQLYPTILDDSYEDVKSFDDEECSLLEHPAFLDSFLQEPTPAQRGTATHIFMQFCDFAFLELYGFRRECQRLTHQSFLSKEIADLVQESCVVGFLKSDFYQNVFKKAQEVHRELRFNIQIPAVEFTADMRQKEEMREEAIFVQGVIDCILKTDQGYILLDYKTDSFSKDVLQSRDTVANILRNRHTRQLSYYQRACKQLLGVDVWKTYIYSFAVQDVIEVFPNNPPCSDTDGTFPTIKV